MVWLKKKNERKLQELNVLETIWLEKKRFDVSKLDGIFNQNRHFYLTNILELDLKIEAMLSSFRNNKFYPNIDVCSSADLRNLNNLSFYFLKNFNILFFLLQNKKIKKYDFLIKLSNLNKNVASIFSIKNYPLCGLNTTNTLFVNKNIVLEILKFKIMLKAFNVRVDLIGSPNISLNYKIYKADAIKNFGSVFEKILFLKNELNFRISNYSRYFLFFENFGIFLNRNYIKLVESNKNSVNFQQFTDNEIVGKYLVKNKRLCNYDLNLNNSTSWLKTYDSANTALNIFLNRLSAKKEQVRSF